MGWKGNKIDFKESKNFVFKSYNCFFVVVWYLLWTSTMFIFSDTYYSIVDTFVGTIKSNTYLLNN